MDLGAFDLFTAAAFLAIVVVVSLWASREENTSEDYFLAGRTLSWWLIGFSLIASNISTEHFVGMAGRGYDLGLAIASYEWMAAVTLIVVGWVLLPRFLAAGIFTVPQYLEVRFGPRPRTLMAAYMMIAYVVVALATVLYSGALALQAVFGVDLTVGIWLIGLIAGAYTVYGGLKAVVWSDLIQGVALLAGGALVTTLGLREVGGLQAFLQGAEGRLHTVLPWDHPEMPWVAVFVGGLWIPNLFYWGLNQFISQRTLAARSLAEGQRGIVFAALLKLLIPFIIVFPGIMAFQLYGDAIPSADQAYPYMITKLLPPGLRGVMFAALFGAVLSSLDSMINSASTIFTIDLYGRFWRPNAESAHLVRIGRIATAACVVFGCLWAPAVGAFGSVFNYIQMFWGFISPGIVAVFLFGIAWRRVPEPAAMAAMLLGVPVYGTLLWILPEVAFLHHMALTFLMLGGVIVVMTLRAPVAPLTGAIDPAPVILVDMRPDRVASVGAVIVVLATITMYVVFW